jgi:LemA protein
MRSTGAIVILVLVLVLGFVGCAGCGSYNALVGADEAVNEQWANLQSQYQRRADLIPNLVATVEGAADFERGTLEAVTEARTRAVNINLSSDDLDDPAAVQRFQEAQSQLGAATGALINAVREDYPELGATENFLSLQDQLEGTENRIATERRRYNEVVTGYNRDIRSFPTNLWAGIFGFDRRVPFEAEEGAAQAPTVEFGA